MSRKARYRPTEVVVSAMVGTQRTAKWWNQVAQLNRKERSMVHRAAATEPDLLASAAAALLDGIPPPISETRRYVYEPVYEL